MQHQQPSPGHGAARGARQTNNDAHLLSLKRLSLQSPSLHSPRQELRRTPSSPGFPPSNLVRRSSSQASMQRSSSPALVRKLSTSSLRSDAPPTPSRRSSFVPNMPSPMGAKSPLPPPQEEKPPLRACDIAEEHFRKDLARHHGTAGTGAVEAGTIVIIHDQCYGHRFSRPKTPKNTLSLIMERPERILASVLGISAAYVRMGNRHSHGSHAPHPDHDPPERVPFQIRKTSRMVDVTSQVVTNVHGTKWMDELKSLCDNAERKLASTGKELARDGPSGPGQPKKELHAGDLYLCPESMKAFQGALGGVLDAVDAVFQRAATAKGPSRAFVCVRPPGHHCSDDYPSGFCWLNNVHVGIEHAMMQHGLTHAAIIDFDLHHGDGSQAITWARNKKVQTMSRNTPNWKKTSIGYFSLHDINSYPCEDGDDEKVQAASLCIENAHGQSIWNVHLQPWKTAEEFWNIYEQKYLVLLEKTRLYLRSHTHRLRTASNHPAPNVAIFLSAGFDASEWETAGMQRHAVNVPTEFYARFTRDVVHLAEEEGTGADGRVISVLEGGYSNRALASGVLSHLSGLCDGQVWVEPRDSKGLAFDMHQRLGGLQSNGEDTAVPSVEAQPVSVTYDPTWWHPRQLSELENLVEPPPIVVPKKPRVDKSAHFSSPTQSFTAKVVDPAKLSRSLSTRQVASLSRAPTPPPPDVDWATATHALSKLLIPSDRQTRSHNPEELAEPRIKKEKLIAPPLESVRLDPSGRQLRGRKAVATYADPGSGDEPSQQEESRANRRKTIANFPLATTGPGPLPRSASRRMSIASSVSSIGDRSVSREPSAPSSRRSVAPAPTKNVPVKKARAPVATTTSRGTQRPPVPRVPSNYAAKASEAKGKENDDLDALTSGLKRITLKMPSKEEHEAREREREEARRAVEASKKPTARTTTRKTPAARTTALKPAAKSATTKRGPGRPPKSSKPPSPTEMIAPVPPSNASKVQTVAAAPVVKPHTIQDEAGFMLEPISDLLPAHQPAGIDVPVVERRTSAGFAEPPAQGATLTPDELREQLPKPFFMVSAVPVPDATPPARAETPPPPSMPEFVNYTAQSFGTAPAVSIASMTSQAPASAIQWLPTNTENDVSASTSVPRPMSPTSKNKDLPVFTATSAIPFAHQVATQGYQSATINAKEEGKDEDMWDIPETPAR